jgi:ABC-type transporter Mla maintaining outer membrane lipid asymmetry ATPase subunit MlaF
MPSAANDDLTVVDNVDFELHQQQDGSEEATRTQQVETQQTNEPANNSVAPDE